MTRKAIDPTHAELTSVLEGMLERNEDVTARAVARSHSSLKNASDITRHAERRALLERYQARQAETRRLASAVQRSGAKFVVKKLQATEERIRELEENESARISSHLAMIAAVCELGGTAKLLRFYQDHARIRDILARQGALPRDLTLIQEQVTAKK